jgi:hypothetical protein
VNIAVDDRGPLIIHEPTAAWFFDGNTSDCAVCLTLPSLSISYNNAWHYGLYAMPVLSANDFDNVSGGNWSDGASVKGLSTKSNNLSGERSAASCNLPESGHVFFTNDRS